MHVQACLRKHLHLCLSQCNCLPLCKYLHKRQHLLLVDLPILLL